MTDWLELAAKRAACGPWVERLARAGLAAKGFSYGLIAALAIGVALGEAARPPIARARCGRSPATAGARSCSSCYGSLLLGAVAAGLLAYGAYCLVEARYREV